MRRGGGCGFWNGDGEGGEGVVRVSDWVCFNPLMGMGWRFGMGRGFEIMHPEGGFASLII